MSDMSLKAVLFGEDRTMGKTFQGAGRDAQTAGRHISTMDKAAAGLGGLAKTAVVGFGAAAVTGLGISISKAMDYDKTMRMVGATLGTTGAQQKALGVLALKMGADTVFSAADAGNAMLELAKGGLTAAQIQGGALQATMTLAAAGSLDMGNAATYVGNALNMFGLKAKDAGAAAAALAGGANASSASVESLGLALSQVGPGARTAGLSIQVTTGILAAFDNAGIKGADAGTSLKTMLTRLVPSTKQATNAMHDLHLKFTDSKGGFVSMANVAEQLKTKMGHLSDEQRTQAMNAIFGSDATRAATVLMNLGAEGVNKYTKATSDQTSAQKMANTQMQGASGAWESFKGSIETLAIGVGVKLLPAFTKFVKWLNDKGLPGIMAIAHWLKEKLTPAFNTMSDWMTNTGLPAIKKFGGWIKDDLWPALQKGYDTIMPGLKSALKILGDAFGGSGKSGSGFGDTMHNIGAAITKYVIPFLSVLISKWLPMLAREWQVIITVVKVVWGAFQFLLGVVTKVVTFILGAFAGITAMWASVLRALSKVPGFGWAKDAADKMDAASRKATGLAKAINTIPNNKGVTITITAVAKGIAAKYASGAAYGTGTTPEPKHKRAGGGPTVAGRTYLVGEYGPELWSESSNGYVTNARNTAAMLSGGRGAGAAGGQVEHVLVIKNPDGRTVERILLDHKRSTGQPLAFV